MSGPAYVWTRRRVYYPLGPVLLVLGLLTLTLISRSRSYLPATELPAGNPGLVVPARQDPIFHLAHLAHLARRQCKPPVQPSRHNNWPTAALGSRSTNYNNTAPALQDSKNIITFSTLLQHTSMPCDPAMPSNRL
jgi:hypothetical protein